MDSFGHKGDELTSEEITARHGQRMHIAADFVRGLYDDETGEWEDFRITVDELSLYPGEDVEALDGFVVLATSNYPPDEAARLINQQSEVDLGLLTLDDIRDIAARERGDTVDGWTGFRDGRRSGDGDPTGADVAPVPIAGNRAARRAVGIRGKRRTGDPVKPRKATGTKGSPVADARKGRRTTGAEASDGEGSATGRIAAAGGE